MARAALTLFKRRVHVGTFICATAYYNATASGRPTVAWAQGNGFS